MIRKTALISFLLLFICFGLMAEPHVALAPYTGAYGVNMASEITINLLLNGLHHSKI